MVAIAGALQVADGRAIFGLLRGHRSGGWGDVTEPDAEANGHAVNGRATLSNQKRLSSEKPRYQRPGGRAADRSGHENAEWAWYLGARHAAWWIDPAAFVERPMCSWSDETRLDWFKDTE